MTQTSILPETRVSWLIQGGMGIAISGWPLARAVASAGQLGVVSGTAIDNVFVRRLQQDGVDAAGGSGRFSLAWPSVSGAGGLCDCGSVGIASDLA